MREAGISHPEAAFPVIVFRRSSSPESRHYLRRDSRLVAPTNSSRDRRCQKRMHFLLMDADQAELGESFARFCIFGCLAYLEHEPQVNDCSGQVLFG